MKEHARKCREYGTEWLPNIRCECDGYHTFDELYEHRIRLFIELCKMKQRYLKQVLETSEDVTADVWCSVAHSDGSTFGDWFILGIGKEKGEQITYHLPARYWGEVCEFAEVLGKAPEWDGHTSDDVLKRLAPPSDH